MTVIDKRKNCIICSNNQYFFVKPKLKANLSARIITHDMITEYELYQLEEKEFNNILSHYMKYNKVVPDIKLSSEPIKIFTHITYFHLVELFNIPSLNYYMTA